MNPVNKSIYRALGVAYESTQLWGSLPLRNRIKDKKTVENVIEILRVDHQGLKIDSKEEFRKCLYINKPIRIKLGNGAIASAEQLSREGNKLLITEIEDMKNLLNKRNLGNLTGLPKSILIGHKYGSTIRHYMRSKNLKGLARISTPENQVPSKVRNYHDQRAFGAIVGYLAHANDEAIMKKFIQEEIMKPIFRVLFT